MRAEEIDADEISFDRVATGFKAFDADAVVISRNDVACAGFSAAYGIVRRGRKCDSGIAVPDRGGAGDIRSNEISLDDVAPGGSFNEPCLSSDFKSKFWVSTGYFLAKCSRLLRQLHRTV